MLVLAMTFGIQESKLFIVECKRCKRDVPAGVQDFPFESIAFLLREKARAEYTLSAADPS
jgi:hypothetical protein